MARRGVGPRFGAVARRLPAIHHQRPGERADPHPRAAAPLVSRRAGVRRRPLPHAARLGRGCGPRVRALGRAARALGRVRAGRAAGADLRGVLARDRAGRRPPSPARPRATRARAGGRRRVRSPRRRGTAHERSAANVGRRQRHAGQRHRVGVRHSAGPLRARADPLPRAGSTMSTVRCALVAGMISLGSPPAWAQGGEPDSVVYVLSAASRFEVKTGKAGLLGFAGHTHVVRARAFVGRVVYYPNAPAQSRVEIVVPVDSLAVLTSSDTAENRKVTHAMRTEVLHADVYPEISFVSTAVTPTVDGSQVRGGLPLAGQTGDVSCDISPGIGTDTLGATGVFSVKQTDFGIRPYRGGPAGTVRVADRVTFDIEAVAGGGALVPPRERSGAAGAPRLPPGDGPPREAPPPPLWPPPPQWWGRPPPTPSPPG